MDLEKRQKLVDQYESIQKEIDQLKTTNKELDKLKQLRLKREAILKELNIKSLHDKVS